MDPDRRMHLVVVAQPVEAGVPHHVADLLPAVLADGWSVTVACPTSSVLWDAAGRLGVDRLAIGPSRLPGPRDALDLARLLPLVRSADVVHAHSSKSGMVVRFAARLAGRSARCVFTPHGWSFWALDGRTARVALALERTAARGGGPIITVSAHERDVALELGIGRAEQYRVVPNGVDERRFTPASTPAPATAGRVVMVARLAPPRLPVLAVQAVRLAARTRPDLTLDLVGDGPLRPDVEAAIAALGPDDQGRVRLLGTRADVPDLLRSAACALHLSTYEGASLGVLEAMATGLPVVASRLGGMDELVVDGVTGRLVGDDPEDVAAALLAVLDGPETAAALGRAGRARVEERFTASGMAAATLAVYRQLLPPR